jgi:vancomycin resistance protein YoaR
MDYPLNRPRFSLEQALLAVFIGLVIFSASLFAFIFGTQIWYAGRIFPGVQVAGIDVGGMSQQDAEKLLATKLTYPQQGKILLRDGDKIWVSSPGELGLFLDPAASAKNAYAVGRHGFVVDRLKDEFYAWYLGENIPPNMIFDQRTAYQYLVNLGKEVDVPAVEASIALNGTDVVVVPGQVGRSIDIPKTLMLISAQVQTLRDGVANLFITETNPVILDASKQAEQARMMLNAPLLITMPEQEANQAGPWSIDQATLATMLAFERVQTDSGSQYQVRLDSDELRSYVTGLGPQLSRAPQNARFTFNDETKQLELIGSASIGRELDVDKTIQSIQEKLYAGEHTIPLVINYTNPPVTDQATADSLGIHELLHAETSYFYGSNSARVQNIQTAASKFHGLLVAPGETFSMASAIGDITLDNGYAEALIILGGQTIKGVGGGVCQVSTTLFRTAFFSGFPIVERHAHAYRVYYYEKVAGNRIDSDLAGLDATVFVPLVDFKFVNDSQSWLLMETYVNPKSSSITWKFYSTSDGRRVDWKTTGPVNIAPAPEPEYHENPDLAKDQIKQVDWHADGADVTVNRTVYKGDSVYLQDTISTHYEPWPDVYEYGPGTDIPPKDSNTPPG